MKQLHIRVITASDKVRYIELAPMHYVVGGRKIGFKICRPFVVVWASRHKTYKRLMQCIKGRKLVLTNFLPIYRVPLLENLAQNVGQLRVFLSVAMEGNRDWPVFWGLLDVVVHRSITIERNFRNSHGYIDQTFTHIPYDTIPLLWSYRPDVVVTSELGVRSLIARFYKVLRPSTKLIVWATLSERTEESRGAIREMLRRWLLRRVDAVYVNGASGARYIRSLEYCGFISIVPYVADNCAFLDPGIRRRDDTLRLLYTGQLIEPLFCEHTAGQGYRHFLYGRGEGIAEKAAQQLMFRYPSIQIAGQYTPLHATQPVGR